MTRHLAFLRAFNVGGRRGTSEQLLLAARSAGLVAPATHLASGNVSFELPDGLDVDRCERLLEEEFAAVLGFASPVFVREVERLRIALDEAGVSAEKPEGGRRNLVVLVRPQIVLEGSGQELPGSRGRVVGGGGGHVFVEFEVGDRVPNPAQEVERTYGVVATGRFAHTLHRLLVAAVTPAASRGRRP